MLGVYFAAGDQHFDMRTLQDHAAPRSTSDLLYKGALKDRSHTVYSGLIRVQPGAEKTDAYQANRNLVLSDHAKADSKPELEILNNDVRCTHGSTVGQVDDEQLFYLESRGISRDDAQRLIVEGFFEDVINRVRVEAVRSVLHDAIARKLGGWAHEPVGPAGKRGLGAGGLGRRRQAGPGHEGGGRQGARVPRERRGRIPGNRRHLQPRVRRAARGLARGRRGGMPPA